MQLLGHCLDDELAVGEIPHVRGVGDPCVEGVVVLLGDLAAVERAAGGLGEHALATLDRSVFHLHRDDVDPVAGEHFHDADTHGAEADHADLGELTTHGLDPPRAGMPCRPPSGVTLPTPGAANPLRPAG